MSENNTTYWTELHTAAKNGDQDTLARLIRNGANLDAVTKLDWTPLHFAAKYGYLDCCRLLIEAGSSTVAPTRLRFFTPIHIAALEGHTELVRFFLECGATSTFGQRKAGRRSTLPWNMPIGIPCDFSWTVAPIRI